MIFTQNVEWVVSAARRRGRKKSPLSLYCGCGDGPIWDVVIDGSEGHVGHIGEQLTTDGEIKVLALERAVDEVALAVDVDVQVGDFVTIVDGFGLGGSDGVACGRGRHGQIIELNFSNLDRTCYVGGKVADPHVAFLAFGIESKQIGRMLVAVAGVVVGIGNRGCGVGLQQL